MKMSCHFMLFLSLIFLNSAVCAMTKNDAKAAEEKLNSVLQNQHYQKCDIGKLPARVQLGMNGVPVLNSGWEWGACTTFSVTAGLDALFQLKGDQLISQTCFIQLARGLPTSKKWWSGGHLVDALTILTRYGYWNQHQQETITVKGNPACGGLKYYPISQGSNIEDIPNFSAMPKKEIDRVAENLMKKDGGNGHPMAATLYKKYSDMRLKQRNWQVISTHINSTNSLCVLSQIKKELSLGHRVLIGMYFNEYLEDHAKTMGAIAYHHDKQDTWALTQKIYQDVKKNPKHFGSHDILMTGYDNNACVRGKLLMPHKQCGLLKLRNSVGANVGDQGDFYMTYDYFRALSYTAVSLKQ